MRWNLATLEVTVEPAAVSDAYELADVMRAEDRAECEALGGGTPLDHIVGSLESSALAYTLRLNGEVAAMYGAAPADDTVLCLRGVVWMLTGRSVARYPKAFWIQCLIGLERMLAVYPCLEQMVDARYEASLRWVRRLGFTVGPIRHMGPGRAPFHHIRIGGNNG